MYKELHITFARLLVKPKLFYQHFRKKNHADTKISIFYL
jgi:hypothetical protein